MSHPSPLLKAQAAREIIRRDELRKSRRNTTLIVAIVIVSVLLVWFGYHPERASSHRLVTGGWAQRSANYYVRSHYCGGPVYWVCGHVFAPVVRCGVHSWCWHGVSHSERFLWATRLRSSSGTINGHNGRVTGFGEY